MDRPATNDARTFALAAHGGQRYGVHPYRVHLDAVAALAAPFGDTARTAAFLHDVVEDTPVELVEIEERFGRRVAECVELLTDEPGVDRAERKTRTHAKLARVDGPARVALVVKAADRLANLRACVDDGRLDQLAVYCREHPEFRGAAYRAGLCDGLWSEIDSIVAVASAQSTRRNS